MVDSSLFRSIATQRKIVYKVKERSVIASVNKCNI